MGLVSEVEAYAGLGLQGDWRIVGKTAVADPETAPSRQVTLIALEAILAARAESGLVFKLEHLRRNLLVLGFPDLNNLVGRHFRIGEVEMLGTDLCKPCNHLERLTSLPGLKVALEGRGGLTAKILRGGKLALGDPFTI